MITAGSARVLDRVLATYPFRSVGYCNAVPYVPRSRGGRPGFLMLKQFSHSDLSVATIG